MENKTISSKYFYGNEVSQYGQQHGYVDYRTLAKAFDAVLNNTIIQCNVGYWETVNGSEVYYTNKETGDIIDNDIIDELESFDNVYENYSDIFQYYIISDEGAKILQAWTNEIVYYNETLDIYLWGVTHYGTSWGYVLTDIEIKMEG